MTTPSRTGRRSLLLIAAICGTLLTGCSTVPDRSSVVEQITTEVQAIPFVESAVGSYANGLTQGHSYNIDIRLADSTTPSQLHELVDVYTAKVLAADLAKHSLRLLVHKDDDAFRVFARQSLSSWVTEEADRWFRLTADVVGPIDWAIGPDPTADIRSISVRLDPDGFGGFVGQLREHARDLADRQWIIKWPHTRADLMGTDFPDAAVTAVVDELTATGERWSVRYDTTPDTTAGSTADNTADTAAGSTADNTAGSAADNTADTDSGSRLDLAVWAPGPDQMEQTARRHLAKITGSGVGAESSIRYTVRAGQTPAVEVWVGGCLAGGSELQQQLNAEYGTC